MSVSSLFVCLSRQGVALEDEMSWKGRKGRSGEGEEVCVWEERERKRATVNNVKTGGQGTPSLSNHSITKSNICSERK